VCVGDKISQIVKVCFLLWLSCLYETAYNNYLLLSYASTIYGIDEDN